MIKRLFGLFSLLVSFYGYGQFPNTQSLGNPITRVVVKGGLFVDSTFALPVFDDTTAANKSGVVKTYKGAMIRTRNPNNTVWMRDSAFKYWFEFGTVGWGFKGNSGTSPSTDFIGTIDNQPLVLKANNSTYLRFNPSTNNVLLGLGAASTNSNQLVLGASSDTVVLANELKWNSRFLKGMINEVSAMYIDTVGGTTAYGYGAYQNRGNPFAVHVTAIGANALKYNQSSEITAIGSQALENNNEGDGNTAVGFRALFHNIDGTDNVAVGDMALFNNTYGSGNQAFGSQAGVSVTVGANNHLFGSGDAITEGNRNTSMGFNSLSNITTGSDNVSYGYSAGSNLYGGASGNISIGVRTMAMPYNSSNTLNIGNIIFGTNINGVDSTISSGKIGIKTVAPDSTLHVVGGLKFVTGRQGAGKVLTSNASGGADWETPATSTSYWADRGSNKISNTNSGNVGIGNTNPIFKLDVTGDANVEGSVDSGPALTVTNNSTNSSSGIVVNCASTGNTALAAFVSNGSNRFTVRNTGEVLFNNSGGSSGQVLQSNGFGNPPSWIAQKWSQSGDNYTTGNLSLGTNSSSAKLAMQTSSVSSIDEHIRMEYSSGVVGAGAKISFTTLGGIEVGSIINERVGAGAYSTALRQWDGASNEEFFRVTSNGTAGSNSVGIGGSPASSAKLDISSTSKGVLLPRMTTTQINAIASPANGLLVYNTTLNKLCVYENGTWKQVTTTNM